MRLMIRLYNVAIYFLCLYGLEYMFELFWPSTHSFWHSNFVGVLLIGILAAVVWFPTAYALHLQFGGSKSN